ncbi:MAG TPA: alpha/beta hydrolase [Patescibacteria group bacterium]|nr:alpha/beta hydrolase [Patescibacteria group bacterium]
MTNYTRVTRQIMHNDSNISYFVDGDNKNPPLMLLPGFTGTHGDLLALATYLKKDFFLIFPEFPGWGESKKENSPLTIEDYAKIVGQIAQELGFAKVGIVGHCMGATVAIETAYQFPKIVRQLFLISTPYQKGTGGQLFFTLMTRLSKKVPQFLRPVFYFWRSRVLTVPLSFFIIKTKTFSHKCHLITKTLFAQSHQDEDVVERNWDSLIHYPYERARKITIPAVLLHGAKDMLIPMSQAEKLQKIFPNAKLVVLPNAGHLPPVETPGEVAKEVLGN